MVMKQRFNTICGGSNRICIILPILFNGMLLVYMFSSSSVNPAPLSEMATVNTVSSSGDPCIDFPMSRTGVPPFKDRPGLINILQRENMKTGVELGVQKGMFSGLILDECSSFEKYMLVDLWAPQKNYADNANVGPRSHDGKYFKAMERVKPYANKIDVCRNYTSICVKNVSDDYFDFIYVDARHDFKGVYEDMVDWWPKLRVGGIMAGHDYVENNDGPLQTGQNWTTNYDGTIDETGTVVKGAVDKFAAEVCRQVTVSYRDAAFNNWAMRK